MNINKRVVAAIAAVVLAAAGIISLVAYVNEADSRAFEGTKLVPAIRVVSDIPGGTKVTDLGDAVEVVKLPEAAVPETALTTLDSVSGRVTTSALVPGEVLVAGQFGDGKDGGDGGAVTVPKGMQEITIKVAIVRAVGGTLKPGDTVGIITSYDSGSQTNFAVNKVLVLASKAVVGVSTESAADEIELRLAVDSLNAEKIVNAAEFGRTYLTKQGDDAEIGRQRINGEDVLK